MTCSKTRSLLSLLSRLRRLCRLAGPLLLVTAAMLVPAAGVMARPSLDEREASLASQLRCVVCQNQTVAESRAPIAQDMRQQIREQLSKGSTDEQVVAFFEQRYGAFVRYNPPWKPSTWLLWLSPFLIALGGLWVLRRNLPGTPSDTLTSEERKRAQQWLEAGQEDHRS
ncbi:cytochrome c-type biogenesis protein CcmH [Diaphorobacter ruginosibacter]|uniref:Cytochrome c-type biogenesis protein n=1 Tax=Diaphorobacter ruginosibacter TaxID=1715720 RepID=A0A7G9RJ86_9BURK|nr:cytochrome c-type biogenesis protein [Diaphorobacter ruginosibacter]QNN55661.1 cytochrome c-type biogenesis protein CcmH [Diaphorobacter ruginosibacter]